MKIIIPMAGRGSRLRPHTLTVPKPLVPVAGKPIVQRLVEDLAASYGGPIEEIAFVIGDFGEQVEKDLIAIAEKLGAKGSVYYQDQPLGTAHAILCAAESMSGPCIVAFADTLFKADFVLDTQKDGIIWVQKVENPSSFGVVELADEGYITNFVEKPETFVSDLAIIGIYFVKDGDNLRNELQYLIDNDIKEKGEYQLTNALENMRAKGLKFFTGQIEEWLDCGNKNAVVYSNQRMLEIHKDSDLIAGNITIVNSTIIAPCFIGKNAHIENCVIGPHASIGHNSTVQNSVIKNSLIQNDSLVENVVLQNSMIGNKVKYNGKVTELSIGDFSEL
ncbi:MAG: sugar phosphate nucleotidyltransferase [Bacteroidota bacterium]